MRLLSDVLTPQVFSEIKASPPRYFVSDNLLWINNAAAKIGIDAPPILDLLDSRFTNSFPFVRAFHGCKPESLAPYRERGLVVSSIDTLNTRALALFGDNERTRKVIEELATKENGYCDQNNGSAFFCLDDARLRECDTHYMIYGSEYLICIASQLGCNSILRNRGVATIVECDVPYHAIPEGYRRGICGEILREIFERRFDRRECGGPLNCGFPIQESIPPNRIVAFHFPKTLRDPYLGEERYQERNSFS